MFLLKNRDRKNRKIVFVGILSIFGIFLILPIHSVGLDNGYARIVYNITGLQNYQLHWNDRFPPGSTLYIYAEADGINHRRLVGVDYILIIKDSNDNTIDTTLNSNRYNDYRVNDFTKFTKIIDKDLDDGAYVAEIHIFDLLNDSIVSDYYENVSHALLNGEDKPVIPYMNRSDIINSSELMTHQYKKIIINFYVDKYASKYPTNRFTIENMTLNREFAPGELIQTNLTIKNNFYDKGTVSLDLLLDNNLVNNATIDLDPYSSKQIILEVPSDISNTIDYGNHTLEVLPTSDNTMGFDFDLIKSFSIVAKEVTIPTRVQYIDIQTDKLIIRPNDSINIAVTVQNKGREGTQKVGININNVPLEQTARFNLSEVRNVTFTVKETEPGEYRITINNTNLSKVFFVEANVTATPSIPTVVQKPPTISKVFIIAGLSVLVVIIYIIRKMFILKNLKKK